MTDKEAFALRTLALQRFGERRVADSEICPTCGARFNLRHWEYCPFCVSQKVTCDGKPRG